MSQPERKLLSDHPVQIHPSFLWAAHRLITGAQLNEVIQEYAELALLVFVTADRDS